MGNVYVLNKGYHNYAEAGKYGKSVFVTEGPVHVFKVDALLHTLKTSLVNYCPETDYLLLSGPVILSVLSVSVLLKRFESINLLLFDAKNQNYSVRKLSNEMVGGINNG